MDKKIVSLDEYKKAKNMKMGMADDIPFMQMNEVAKNVSIDLYMVNSRLKKRMINDLEGLFENAAYNLEGLKNHPEMYDKLNAKYHDLWERYQKAFPNGKKSV